MSASSTRVLHRGGWYRAGGRLSPVARGQARLVAHALAGNFREEQLAQTFFDKPIARAAFTPPPRGLLDYRLGHVAMATGAADVAKQVLDRLARVVAAHAIVANRDHQVATQFSCHRNPFHALELKAEVRDLHDDVVTRNLAQVQHRKAVDHFDSPQ